MNFFSDVLSKPISLTWLIVTGSASVLGIFGFPDSLATSEKFLGVLVFSFGLGFFLALWRAWELASQVRAPLKVRAVVDGSHHYKGTLVVILGSANWIETEQILILFQVANGVQTPLALLRVETFTTQGFPQAIVLEALTDDDLLAYLSDSSRWKSLIVLPEIKFRYLGGAQNG